jgi:nucleotide-binding universal stress UspA family protein
MTAHETVLVGTDGSASAQAAVRWAAVEADRRDATLHIVHAYDETWVAVPDLPQVGVVETAHNRAEEIVIDARMAAKTTAPSVTVHADATRGDPVITLLEAAATADLVVVGNRGRGGFTSLMLGSTSQRVATHAPCPTVVVRGRTMAIEGPVVVGADGSAGGAHALQMAFEAAAARRTSVVAVRAYQLPSVVLTPALPSVIVTPDECETAERESLATLLVPWRDKFPTVRVETLVSCGDAARVLVGASHTAQLIVVGSRGLGAFVGTVLGSVGGQLLHHADCPVLIARA